MECYLSRRPRAGPVHGASVVPRRHVYGPRGCLLLAPVRVGGPALLRSASCCSRPYRSRNTGREQQLADPSNGERDIGGHGSGSVRHRRGRELLRGTRAAAPSLGPVSAAGAWLPRDQRRRSSVVAFSLISPHRVQRRSRA